MYAKSYSGFPELLPEGKRQEQQIIKLIQEVYEAYNFTPIETAAIEKKEFLQQSTGDVSKEIYAINRIQDSTNSGKYGLHFDLTLPFARYTAENFSALQFPFKRYQIQKVWRGERAQKGRFREFYQADIDIVNENTLPLHYEAELIEIIYTIFNKLNLDFKIHLNNRKLLDALYQENNIINSNEYLIILDKINKIGKEEVKKLLQEAGLNEEKANFCVTLAETKLSYNEAIIYLTSLQESNNEDIKKASSELLYILNNIDYLPKDLVILDLSIARGLDYYTGCVYECFLTNLESYGSICSGGRYDNLAEKFGKRKLPGVGISIGLSRLLYILQEQNLIKQVSAPTPCKAFIVLFNEEQRKQAQNTAYKLRQENINIEIAPFCTKIAKQIKFAEKRGSQYLIFLEEDDKISLKNLATTEQETINLTTLINKLK